MAEYTDSRMPRTGCLALVVILVACGHPSKPVPPRTSKPRASLPQAIQPVLPKRGIYAAGGGLTSSPWRVVVDQDAGTIKAGTAAGANKPSFGPMDKESTATPDAASLKELGALADKTWREERQPNLHPIADYDEIVVLLDGDETFMIQGFGPIRTGAAKELLDRLKTYLPR